MCVCVRVYMCVYLGILSLSLSLSFSPFFVSVPCKTAMPQTDGGVLLLVVVVVVGR